MEAESRAVLPSAAIWRRVFALLYDSLILVAISMAYGALTLAAWVLVKGPPQADYNPVLGGVLFQLGWLASLCMFYFYFWRRNGQTIGMRAWRLKLVGSEREQASVRSCAIRLLVSPPLIALFFFAYIWQYFDRDGLCLQDRISGTRVVLLPKS